MLGQDLEGGMENISSIPADETTGQNMETLDETAVDSCDSEMTVSDQLLGIAYCANKAQDDDMEAESAMALPAVAEEEKISYSGRTLLQGDGFGQIAGHGYTDGLQEVGSASHAKRAVGQSKYIQVPLGDWLKKIDSGRGLWTATKSVRSVGKQYDRYYFHKEYSHKFRSKANVYEFLRNGTVKGKVIFKKKSAGTTTNDHDYRQTIKRQRTGAATSSSTSGSVGLTRGQMTPTRSKLPHGFL